MCLVLMVLDMLINGLLLLLLLKIGLILLFTIAAMVVLAFPRCRTSRRGWVKLGIDRVLLLFYGSVPILV